MMIELNKIRLKQILIFSQLVNELSFLKSDYIKRKYQEDALNFEETKEFFENLKLIKIRNNRIILTQEYKVLLKNIFNTPDQLKIIQSFIIDKLFIQQNPYSEYISEFVASCHFNDPYFEFSFNLQQKLKFSDLRNFLIELELLRFNSTKNNYIIIGDLSSLITYLKASRNVSPDEFTQVMKNREKIGMEAEHQTILYEKDRLSNDPYLAKRIEHVALKDVTAGYDIKSFELKRDLNGSPVTRYIEVKAVPQYNYKFYWTKNEIEMAKNKKSKYFLYLLPIKENLKFNFENMKIIRNPYSNVYRKQIRWKGSVELLSFSLLEENK